MIRVKRESDQKIDKDVITNSIQSYEIKLFGMKVYSIDSHIKNVVKDDDKPIKIGFHNGT